MIRIFLFLIAMMSLSHPAPMVWASSMFDPPRQFVATQSCRATASIRSGSAPVVVQAGQTFKAFGTKKKTPDATHVQIDVKGQRKWIDLTCGDLRVEVADKVTAPGQRSPSAVPPTRRESRFRPFFDHLQNPENVRFGGPIVRSTIKGYGLTLSAADILKAGTKALADNPTRSTRNESCLLRVQDDGKDFSMVFVRKAQGIRTFFPDATPSASDPACRGVVSIR